MNSWYVAYTQPHAESKALHHLERQGYAAYLPLYRKRRRHARRTEQVVRPLFPRYLFVGFDITVDRWRPIMSTIGVCGLVKNGDDPIPVQDGIVEAIRNNETKGNFDNLSPTKGLRAGDAVRIVEGPFADLIGQFRGLADAERVIVLLDLMGRQVSTRVSAEVIVAA